MSNVKKDDDFQWYLEKPEVKDVAVNNKYLQMPKLRWNPFTYTFAIGFTGAVVSLGYGLHCTLKDRRMMIQKMMEARVMFQAVAVVSVVAGMVYFNRQCQQISARKEE